MLIATVLLGTLASSSCVGPKGDNTQEQLVSAAKMREKALAALYEDKPELREEVEKSLGYGVFSNFSVHPGLLSFASGYGVITNNATGNETHSKWHRLTIGPGIAVKGLYGLLLFQDADVLAKFEKGRWAPFGQIEASFVFGDFGGSLEHAWTYGRAKGVDVHYLTHTGVALEAELIGFGKMTRNDELTESANP